MQKFLNPLSRLKFPLVLRKVVGHSMVPNLPPKTLVIAYRVTRRVRVGDIVIFLHEGKEKIKRVSEIKQEEVFVLGDHSETSTDSRHFGWISRDKIMAKVFWPRKQK